MEIIGPKEIQIFPGALEYEARVDFAYKIPLVHNDGILLINVLLRKETEKSGWIIVGTGTG